MSESPQRWLSDLYRASSREEAPAFLDRAILAEARKASRFPASIVSGWGAPLAAAAVVVMTVSLVIALRDTPPYVPDLALRNDMPEPSVNQESGSDAFASKRSDKPMPGQDQRYAQLSAPKQETRGDAKPDQRIKASERDATAARVIRDETKEAAASTPASKAEPAERGTPAGPSLASPESQREAREHMHAAPAIAPPAAAARALGKLSAPGEEVVEQRRARSSAESDQAGPQAKQGIASNDVPRRLESAVDDRVSPEAWLERIAKLRDEGRHAEARESLAAFKKRYPDHPLPDALRSY
jgi:hypothetical protein